MALLDVAFLCDDPDFASAFTVIRSTGFVSGFGEYKTMEGGQTLGTGAVFPATPETLARLADGSNLNGAIEIWTRLRLVASSGRDELDADRILWNGKPYTVLEVSAYGAWGEGFHHVVARLAALNPS